MLGPSAASKAQPYRFLGNEALSGASAGLYDFGARTYDPSLGRFLSPDPLAELHPEASPYAYCLGNPVAMIDRDGRCAFLVTALIGAGTDYAIQVTMNLARGDSFKDAFVGDVDFIEVGISTISPSAGAGKAVKVAIAIGQNALTSMVKFSPNDGLKVSTDGAAIVKETAFKSFVNLILAKAGKYLDDARVSTAEKADKAAWQAQHDSNIAATRLNSAKKQVKAAESLINAEISYQDAILATMGNYTFYILAPLGENEINKWYEDRHENNYYWLWRPEEKGTDR